MMIESNIRRMGRLELLYTCLSNLVKRINKDGRKDLMGGLEHYADQDDRNCVVYHDSSVPQ
ncbi:MAG: DDE transposase, partial [Bacilli bacterium]